MMKLAEIYVSALDGFMDLSYRLLALSVVVVMMVVLIRRNDEERGFFFF